MRRIASVLGIIFVALVCAAAPASAAVVIPPIAGQLSCGLDGTMKFSRALPNSNSDGAARNVHVKVSAKISKCNNKNVTGGKPLLPITGGLLTINGILEAGASCFDLDGSSPPDFTFDPNVLQVRWTGTTGPTGTSHPAVGKSKTDVFTTGNISLGQWQYLSDAFGDNDAFAGESATINLDPDSASRTAVNSCVNGDADDAGKLIDLKQVTFTSGEGSKILIAP